MLVFPSLAYIGLVFVLQVDVAGRCRKKWLWGQTKEAVVRVSTRAFENMEQNAWHKENRFSLLWKLPSEASSISSL